MKILHVYHRACVRAVMCFTPTITHMHAGVKCANARFGRIADEDVLSCELPEGFGKAPAVQVTCYGRKSAFYSEFLSYMPPSVVQIRGCVDTSFETEDCEKSQVNNITIVGQNFGASGAVVLVDGQVCTRNAHDVASPHTELLCTLPHEISGTDLGVLVLQRGGQLSGTEGGLLTVSMTQCDYGYYQVGVECVECGAGQFSSVLDAGECEECPAGRFTVTNVTKTCALCPSGKFSAGYASDTRGTTCFDCERNTFNQREGQAQCLACVASPKDPSRVSEPGSSSCTDCPRGKFYSVLTNPIGECVACAKGKFSEYEGARACMPCQTGKYAAFIGSVSCALAPVGTFTDSTNAQNPTTCGDGEYMPFKGAISCLECPGTKCAWGILVYDVIIV
jgi:hypothetical protein